MVRNAVIFRLALSGFVALAAVPASAQPFQVFLTSGASIVATSRPLVALGKVSFLDENRRSVTLPVNVVNVDATKQAAGRVTSTGRVWDDKALTKLKGAKVQFYGDDPGTPATAAEETADAAQPDDGKTPAERLRGEIDALNAKIGTLPTSDRQRSMLVIRQLELQEELSRMLTSPRRG